MKKVIFASFIFAILAISSCSKKSTPASIDTWTLHAFTYSPTSTFVDQNVLAAVDSYADTIAFEFPNNTLPATGGEYTVVGLYQDITAANQISMYAVVGQATYIPLNGGTVNVKISGGKVNISGIGISMTNPNGPSDVTSTTFNITQR